MVCNTCHTEKTETEFTWKHKDKGIRHRICRICQNRYQAAWYARRRQHHISLVAERRRGYKQEIRSFILQYLKDHPCAMCGETNPIVLDFDHLDPRKKRMDVGKLLSGGWSPEYVREEVSRCQVLCANCHRIKTATDQGWFKTAQGRDE